MDINKFEVLKALNKLHHPGDVFEIRIIGPKTWSGYFTDPEKAVDLLGLINAEGNVYCSIQAINPACHAREQGDKLMICSKSTKTTSDKDATDYKWLVIDIDPERPSGVSATDAEKTEAEKVACKVMKDLEAHGFPRPFIGDSGNGWHLIYEICFPADDNHKALLKRFLEVLDTLHSTDMAKIDRSVFSPGQVLKLYGTLATKGANTSDRPYRWSKIRYLPESLEIVPEQTIADYCMQLPPVNQKEKPQKYNGYSPSTFNLSEWLDKHGIAHGDPSVGEDGWTKYKIECPFCHNNDSSVMQHTNGRLGFHCFHNSCNTIRWADLRRKIEPTDAELNMQIEAKQKYQTNSQLKKKKPELFAVDRNIFNFELGDPPEGPEWKSAKEARAKGRKERAFVPTGTAKLDELLGGGFEKRGVTMLLGGTGDGKSTWLSQCMANAIDAGFKVGCYSGELDMDEFMDWQYLQISGPTRNIPTGNGGWRVPEEYMPIIDDYLDGKFFIYDNDFGTNYKKFIPSMATFLLDHEIDIVFLDNFMFLEVGNDSNGQGQWNTQTSFCKWLQFVAKKTNTAIVLVVHPNGSGYAPFRMYDCQGSANVYNACSNFLIMHRIDQGFKEKALHPHEKRRKLELTEDDPIFQATNAIEISKCRKSKHRGSFVPLYYDAKSLRMNSKQYGPPKVYKVPFPDQEARYN